MILLFRRHVLYCFVSIKDYFSLGLISWCLHQQPPPVEINNTMENNEHRNSRPRRNNILILCRDVQVFRLQTQVLVSEVQVRVQGCMATARKLDIRFLNKAMMYWHIIVSTKEWYYPKNCFWEIKGMWTSCHWNSFEAVLLLRSQVQELKHCPRVVPEYK